MKNKLFFFGGYQGTTCARIRPISISLCSDGCDAGRRLYAFASPACNAGRQITLRAPFVNNRSIPRCSANRCGSCRKLPKTSDPCGKIIYGNPNLENDHMAIGRIDYQRSASHSMFGRYLLDTLYSPPAYDLNNNLLSVRQPVGTTAWPRRSLSVIRICSVRMSSTHSA